METLRRLHPMSNILVHHGVKGQRWGVRRYQNYDGTLIKKANTSTKTSSPKKGTPKKREAYDILTLALKKLLIPLLNGHQKYFLS